MNKAFKGLSFRIPLPRQTGGFHSTKGGKKKFNRQTLKLNLKKEVADGRSVSTKGPTSIETMGLCNFWT